MKDFLNIVSFLLVWFGWFMATMALIGEIGDWGVAIGSGLFVPAFLLREEIKKGIDKMG